MRRVEASPFVSIGAGPATDSFLNDVGANDTDDHVPNPNLGSRWKTTRLPSIQALDSNDERQLSEELQMIAIRNKIALVRALADRIESLALAPFAPVRQADLVENTARLGCHILELAAELSKTANGGPKSGLLPLCSIDSDVFS